MKFFSHLTIKPFSHFISNFLTISKGKAEILKSREIPTLENREMESMIKF